MEIKKRIDELVEIITKADYNYHTLDKPIITDQEYDSLLRELISLEHDYPEYKRIDSPTRRAGGEVLESFKKVSHEVPMLSLANVFNEEEIENFNENTRKEIKDFTYMLEAKIDGLSISLIYEKGLLKEASTRGNGTIGEDVTHNIKTVRSIPLKLKDPLDIEVRGEVFMDFKTFERLNKIQKEKGLSPYQNPRNLAAGTIRQMDSKIAAKRHLSSFMYQIIKPENYHLNTQEEVLNFLDSYGFNTNHLNKKVTTIKEIMSYISFMNQKRSTLEYPIDGVVLKINEIKYWDKLGRTAKFPKWGVAYKFPEKEILTKLEDIIFTVGKTGKIVPNAILNPVLINGSTVRRASLYNEDYVKSLDLRIGDTVKIVKAAEIIPRVEAVIKDRRIGKEIPFQMITHCPMCHSSLVKKEGLTDWFCPNSKCPRINQEKLINFASRDVMNIEGLGEEIIIDFYNLGYLKTYSDIYKLKAYQKELEELEGYGKKSIDNLFKSIEKSKSNSLERLVTGLNISGIGIKTADLISSKYKTMSNLIKAKFEDLDEIPGIGKVLAKEIVNFFTNYDNLKEIEELTNLGLNMTYLKKKESNPFFQDKTFVVTGTLNNMTRKEIESLIEEKGGYPKDSVTSKTNYVIVGDNPGSKYDKALKLNITILKEEDILKELNS